MRGLRREELAALAGVSTSHHTRLEQDRSPDASPEVLDAHTRELYADWPAKARAVVGNPHRTAAQHPADTALSALIGELSARSREFAAVWADHRVRTCTTTAHEMRHPIAEQRTCSSCRRGR
ncbi:helix-turn-helix domain-containing protein [Umezawaea beigongshangensis]|uniref:helix-turn-helix domain-containing protein n=1 Tax=Umezawaea beigongshangensis TaxID=2780383 RepID=UPI0018F1630F|nr:helix-turn-helix domain-containing protein [Umezawaea beigongshangensis]